MNLRLNFFVLHVGQMCNLRCKNCSNFVPYAPPESRRYPVEQIISDMEALFKVVKRIDTLQVQGGEPLIYSDFPKLLGYLAACREIGEIVIATNGMRLPDDEVWRLCKIHNIKIRISDYPQNRKNIQIFAQKAADFGCHETLYLYNFVDRQSFWYDCGGLDTPREDDDDVVTARFDKCAFNGCLTLENGQLHRCGRGVNAHKVLGFKQTFDDFVQVRNNPRLKYDLVMYLVKPTFETACRYCNGTFGVKQIPPAEQL